MSYHTGSNNNRSSQPSSTPPASTPPVTPQPRSTPASTPPVTRQQTYVSPTVQSTPEQPSGGSRITKTNIDFGATPILNLPRFCDGDIYGFSVLTNPDPNSIDDISNNWPFVDDDLNESFFTSGHAGGIIAEGAVGMSPNSNLPYLKWPAEIADRQEAKNPEGFNDSHTPRQPTIYKYQWYSTKTNEVNNSNRITMSSAFHEAYYIDKWGKLKALGTAYSFKPSMLRMFGTGGPILHQGADPRIFEIWQADPNRFGYDPDINLVHISCAADETIATLDSNGTIRIVQAGLPGVSLETMGENTDYQVVYFGKEDIENGFWIDEDGENVFLENIDFVDVWCSGGGTSAQGVCVWGLHKSGKLYGQHIHNVMWNNRNFQIFDPTTGAYVHTGRYEAMPYYIRPLDEEGEPQGEEVINIYYGARGRTTGSEYIDILNRYGYSTSTFQGSIGTHYDGISEWFGIDIESTDNWIEDPKFNGGIYPRFNNELIKHALNQIPKNEAGKRYKVLSLFDGYGHGGGCTCVDPDIPSDNVNSLNQKIEPVLFNSWASSVHRHMYEHIHPLKKWRSVKDSNGDYSYELNNQGTFAFNSELYDLLFKSKDGTYKPPIRFSSSRRNFCVLTNTGMVGSFQGAGSDETLPPIVNYRLNEKDEIEPILDSNGSITKESGNWFFNNEEYESNPAFQIIPWNANLLADDQAGPDKGPHVISTSSDGPQLIGGRFGFGHMPPRADGTYPGINPEPWREMDIGIRTIYWFNYFSYIKYLGYDHEDYYWNMDSLVYFDTLEDDQGRTFRNNPDEFHRGHSAIHIFHVGEGSPYSPFDRNPVVWWAGQGDNMNAVFKNGVVDSCTFFQRQMSSFVWPPAALPLTPQQRRLELDDNSNNIEHHSYENGKRIPGNFPTAYQNSLNKAGPAGQKCGNCKLFNQNNAYCSAWKATANKNYWCQSYIPYVNITMNGAAVSSSGGVFSLRGSNNKLITYKKGTTVVYNGELYEVTKTVSGQLPDKSSSFVKITNIDDNVVDGGSFGDTSTTSNTTPTRRSSGGSSSSSSSSGSGGGY